MTKIETYLGDGLYASFDGYQICLRAPRPVGDHVVFLDPSVVKALLDYLTQLTREAELAKKTKADKG